jgi:hypothetical protein
MNPTEPRYQACKKIFEAKVTKERRTMVSLSKPAVRAGCFVAGTESDLPRNEHYAVVGRLHASHIDALHYVQTEGETRDCLFVNDQVCIMAIDRSIFCLKVNLIKEITSELTIIPEVLHNDSIR